MATGKNQPQPIVLDALLVPFFGLERWPTRLLRKFFERRAKPGASTYRVNRFESPGRDQPGARIGGHALLRPLFYRCGKGVVQGLFSPIKVAQQMDERSQNPARLRTINLVHNLVHSHRPHPPSSRTPDRIHPIWISIR
jgi:hypothetical protein